MLQKFEMSDYFLLFLFFYDYYIILKYGIFLYVCVEYLG